MQAAKIISTHPDVQGSTNDALAQGIEDFYNCAQTCIACADACLAEDVTPELKQCIRTDLDCAAITAATGEIASRRTGSNEELLRQMLQTCETACRLCAEECEKHADKHEHCKICAEACRKCEETCQNVLQTLG